MAIIDTIKAKAKQRTMHIVLPEGEEKIRNRQKIRQIKITDSFS